MTKSLFHVSDAHTTEDVDYRWKGGKSQGVEIVSKEMAQFEFVGAKTSTKANTNSKGKQFQSVKITFVAYSFMPFHCSFFLIIIFDFTDFKMSYSLHAQTRVCLFCL